MPEPHEMLREWDGKIDGFFLINQMMALKNEIQIQSDRQKDAARSKLQNKSESYKSSSGYKPLDAPVLSRPQQSPPMSSQFTLPKVPAQTEQPKPKFESNPKLKLSRKGKEDQGDYVAKPKADSSTYVPKALDVADLEKQLGHPGTKAIGVADLEKGLHSQKTAQPAPIPKEAIDVESLEKELKPKIVSVNVEDLEKGFSAGKVSQPTDIEEIEAQMQRQTKK